MAQTASLLPSKRDGAAARPLFEGAYAEGDELLQLRPFRTKLLTALEVNCFPSYTTGLTAAGYLFSSIKSGEDGATELLLHLLRCQGPPLLHPSAARHGLLTGSFHANRLGAIQLIHESSDEPRFRFAGSNAVLLGEWSCPVEVGDTDSKPSRGSFVAVPETGQRARTHFDVNFQLLSSAEGSSAGNGAPVVLPLPTFTPLRAGAVDAANAGTCGPLQYHYLSAGAFPNVFSLLDTSDDIVVGISFALPPTAVGAATVLSTPHYGMGIDTEGRLCAWVRTKHDGSIASPPMGFEDVTSAAEKGEPVAQLEPWWTNSASSSSGGLAVIRTPTPLEYGKGRWYAAALRLAKGTLDNSVSVQLTLDGVVVGEQTFPLPPQQLADTASKGFPCFIGADMKLSVQAEEGDDEENVCQEEATASGQSSEQASATDGVPLHMLSRHESAGGIYSPDAASVFIGGSLCDLFVTAGKQSTLVSYWPLRGSEETLLQDASGNGRNLFLRACRMISKALKALVATACSPSKPSLVDNSSLPAYLSVPQSLPPASAPHRETADSVLYTPRPPVNDGSRSTHHDAAFLASSRDHLSLVSFEPQAVSESFQTAVELAAPSTLRPASLRFGIHAAGSQWELCSADWVDGFNDSHTPHASGSGASATDLTFLDAVVPVCDTTPSAVPPSAMRPTGGLPLPPAPSLPLRDSSRVSKDGSSSFSLDEAMHNGRARRLFVRLTFEPATGSSAAAQVTATVYISSDGAQTTIASSTSSINLSDRNPAVMTCGCGYRNGSLTVFVSGAAVLTTVVDLPSLLRLRNRHDRCHISLAANGFGSVVSTVPEGGEELRLKRWAFSGASQPLDSALAASPSAFGALSDLVDSTTPWAKQADAVAAVLSCASLPANDARQLLSLSSRDSGLLQGPLSILDPHSTPSSWQSFEALRAAGKLPTSAASGSAAANGASAASPASKRAAASAVGKSSTTANSAKGNRAAALRRRSNWAEVNEFFGIQLDADADGAGGSETAHGPAEGDLDGASGRTAVQHEDKSAAEAPEDPAVAVSDYGLPDAAVIGHGNGDVNEDLRIKCAACTYLNPLTRTLCEVCDAKLYDEKPKEGKKGNNKASKAASALLASAASSVANPLFFGRAAGAAPGALPSGGKTKAPRASESADPVQSAVASGNPNSAPELQRGRACPQCTYINGAKALRCEICDTLLVAVVGGKGGRPLKPKKTAISLGGAGNVRPLLKRRASFGGGAGAADEVVEVDNDDDEDSASEDEAGKATTQSAGAGAAQPGADNKNKKKLRSQQITDAVLAQIARSKEKDAAAGNSRKRSNSDDGAALAAASSSNLRKGFGTGNPTKRNKKAGLSSSSFDSDLQKALHASLADAPSASASNSATSDSSWPGYSADAFKAAEEAAKALRDEMGLNSTVSHPHEGASSSGGLGWLLSCLAGTGDRGPVVRWRSSCLGPIAFVFPALVSKPGHAGAGSDTTSAIDDASLESALDPCIAVYGLSGPGTPVIPPANLQAKTVPAMAAAAASSTSSDNEAVPAWMSSRSVGVKQGVSASKGGPKRSVLSGIAVLRAAVSSLSTASPAVLISLRAIAQAQRRLNCVFVEPQQGDASADTAFQRAVAKDNLWRFFGSTSLADASFAAVPMGGPALPQGARVLRLLPTFSTPAATAALFSPDAGQFVGLRARGALGSSNGPTFWKGKKTVPVARRLGSTEGSAGLANLVTGLVNVCYQNSLLQALFHTEALRRALVDDAELSALMPLPPSDAIASSAGSSKKLGGWLFFASPFGSTSTPLSRDFDVAGAELEDYPLSLTMVAEGEAVARVKGTAASEIAARSAALANRLQWTFARLSHSSRTTHSLHALQAVLPSIFTQGKQQDVGEFFLALSDAMASAQLRRRLDGKALECAPLEATFGGIFAEARSCHECGSSASRKVQLDAFSQVNAQFPPTLAAMALVPSSTSPFFSTTALGHPGASCFPPITGVCVVVVPSKRRVTTTRTVSTRAASTAGAQAGQAPSMSTTTEEPVVQTFTHEGADSTSPLALAARLVPKGYVIVGNLDLNASVRTSSTVVPASVQSITTKRSTETTVSDDGSHASVCSVTTTTVTEDEAPHVYFCVTRDPSAGEPLVDLRLVVQPRLPSHGSDGAEALASVPMTGAVDVVSAADLEPLRGELARQLSRDSSTKYWSFVSTDLNLGLGPLKAKTAGAAASSSADGGDNPSAVASSAADTLPDRVYLAYRRAHPPTSKNQRSRPSVTSAYSDDSDDSVDDDAGQDDRGCSPLVNLTLCTKQEDAANIAQVLRRQVGHSSDAAEVVAGNLRSCTAYTAFSSAPAAVPGLFMVLQRDAAIRKLMVKAGAAGSYFRPQLSYSSSLPAACSMDAARRHFARHPVTEIIAVPALLLKTSGLKRPLPTLAAPGTTAKTSAPVSALPPVPPALALTSSTSSTGGASGPPSSRSVEGVTPRGTSPTASAVAPGLPPTPSASSSSSSSTSSGPSNKVSGFFKSMFSSSSGTDAASGTAGKKAFKLPSASPPLPPLPSSSSAVGGLSTASRPGSRASSVECFSGDREGSAGHLSAAHAVTGKESHPLGPTVPSPSPSPAPATEPADQQYDTSAVKALLESDPSLFPASDLTKPPPISGHHIVVRRGKGAPLYGSVHLLKGGVNVATGCTEELAPNSGWETVTVFPPMQANRVAVPPLIRPGLWSGPLTHKADAMRSVHFNSGPQLPADIIVVQGNFGPSWLRPFNTITGFLFRTPTAGAQTNVPASGSSWAGKWHMIGSYRLADSTASGSVSLAFDVSAPAAGSPAVTGEGWLYGGGSAEDEIRAASIVKRNDGFRLGGRIIDIAVVTEAEFDNVAKNPAVYGKGWELVGSSLAKPISGVSAAGSQEVHKSPFASLAPYMAALSASEAKSSPAAGASSSVVGLTTAAAAASTSSEATKAVDEVPSAVIMGGSEPSFYSLQLAPLSRRTAALGNAEAPNADAAPSEPLFLAVRRERRIFRSNSDPAVDETAQTQQLPRPIVDIIVVTRTAEQAKAEVPWSDIVPAASGYEVIEHRLADASKSAAFGKTNASAASMSSVNTPGQYLAVKRLSSSSIWFASEGGVTDIDVLWDGDKPVSSFFKVVDKTTVLTTSAGHFMLAAGDPVDLGGKQPRAFLAVKKGKLQEKPLADCPFTGVYDAPALSGEWKVSGGATGGGMELELKAVAVIKGALVEACLGPDATAKRGTTMPHHDDNTREEATSGPNAHYRSTGVEVDDGRMLCVALPLPSQPVAAAALQAPWSIILNAPGGLSALLPGLAPNANPLSASRASFGASPPANAAVAPVYLFGLWRPTTTGAAGTGIRPSLCEMLVDGENGIGQGTYTVLSTGHSESGSSATTFNWRIGHEDRTTIAFRRDPLSVYDDEGKLMSPAIESGEAKSDIKSLFLSSCLSPQLLALENRIHCPKCDRRTEHLSTPFLALAPSHLSLVLARMNYSLQHCRSIKIKDSVDVPISMELPVGNAREADGASLRDALTKAYAEGGPEVEHRSLLRRAMSSLEKAASGTSTAKYGLYGVIFHRGDTPNSGHYYAYCRRSEPRLDGTSVIPSPSFDLSIEDCPGNPWRKYNDETVSEVKWRDVAAEIKSSASSASSSSSFQGTPYVLYYKRIDGQDEADATDSAVQAAELYSRRAWWADSIERDNASASLQA